MMKTTASLKPAEVEKKRIVIDAENAEVGRLATFSLGGFSGGSGGRSLNGDGLFGGGGLGHAHALRTFLAFISANAMVSGFCAACGCSGAL